MFLTVHATAAIIISQHITNPIIGFGLGFISHYVLDAIPHGDDAFFARYPEPQRTKEIAKWAAGDIALTILWSAWLCQTIPGINLIVAIPTIFGSMLSDLLNGFYLLTKVHWLKWNYDATIIAHRLLVKTPLPALQGFSIQAVFFV